MNFKEYKALYEASPDDIEKPSRELAKEWLEAQFEAHRRIQKINDELAVPLCYGKLNYGEGEYEHEIIETVSTLDPIFYGVPTFQMWKGIDLLAEILGLPLEMQDRGAGSSYRYEYSFVYKGVKVMQVSEGKL